MRISAFEGSFHSAKNNTVREGVVCPPPLVNSKPRVSVSTMDVAGMEIGLLLFF